MKPSNQEVLGYNLHADETVLLHTKPKKSAALYFLISKTQKITFLLLFFIIFTLLNGSEKLYYLPLVKNIENNLSALHYWLIPLTILLVILLYFWLKMIVASYDYVITNQRIFLRYGFLMTNTRVIPYNKLNDINVQTTVLARCFGLETVYLDTSGITNLNSSRSNTLRMEGLSPAISKQVLETISQFIGK